MVSDDYSVCPMCGGNDGQGCYESCPTLKIEQQADEIERLREALGGVKDCLADKNYIDAEMIIDHALQQKETT